MYLPLTISDIQTCYKLKEIQHKSVGYHEPPEQVQQILQAGLWKCIVEMTTILPRDISSIGVLMMVAGSAV